MKRRIDETSDKEIEVSGEKQETSSEKPAEKKKGRSRYSATLYVTIMFLVVVLLIFLSYFVQQRNSKALEDLVSQHSEFSIEAMQNIEELQSKNIELMKEVKELESELSDMQEGDLAEDYKAVCNLLDMEIAIENGDNKLAKEKAELIEPIKDTLEEDYLEKYEQLVKKIN